MAKTRGMRISAMVEVELSAKAPSSCSVRVGPSGKVVLSPAAKALGLRELIPQREIVDVRPSKTLPSITKTPSFWTSSPFKRIAGGCASCVDSACHQPEPEIWSPVRKDDTRSPSVGNSQSATSSAAEI